MSFIILTILLIISYSIYYFKNMEIYLVVVFSLLSVIGLFNRIAIYYFHEYNNVIMLGNILFFFPLLIFFIKRIKRIKMSKSNIFIFIFYFFVMIQFINIHNLNIQAKIFDLATYTLFFIFILIPYFYTFNYIKYFQYTYKIFFPIFIFISIYGIFQYILGPNIIDTYWMNISDFAILGIPQPFMIKPFSTTASPGHYALINFYAFLISLIFITYDKFINSFIKKNILSYITFTLAIVGTLISGVRSVLILEIFIFIFYFLFLKKSILKFKTLIPIIILFFISFYFLQKFDLSNLTDRLESFNRIQNASDYSLNARIEMAKIVVNEIMKNPFGYGLGSSGKFTNGSFINIDNGYLEIIYEIGFLALFALFIYFFQVLFSKKKSKQILKDLSFLSILSILFLMLANNFMQLFISWYLFLFISIHQQIRQKK